MSDLKEENFSGLIEYITLSDENLRKIRAGNIEPGEKTLLIYEMYANFVDLQEECRCVLREMRSTFKVKDFDIKKWMRENENDEPSEPASSPAE